MKHKRFFAAVVLIFCAGVLRGGAARADTVLYNSTGLITGTQSFTQSFDITAPGTLTVSLTPTPWFDTLKDLSFFVSTPNGVLDTTTNNGIQSLHFASAEEFFANWFGTAAGAFKIGAYSLTIRFQPDSVAPVPLPLPFVLLFSGLTLLLIWRRPRAGHGNAVQRS